MCPGQAQSQLATVLSNLAAATPEVGVTRALSGPKGPRTLHYRTSRPFWGVQKPKKRSSFTLRRFQRVVEGAWVFLVGDLMARHMRGSRSSVVGVRPASVYGLGWFTLGLQLPKLTQRVGCGEGLGWFTLGLQLPR